MNKKYYFTVFSLYLLIAIIMPIQGFCEGLRWQTVQEIAKENNEKLKARSYDIDAKVAAKFSAYGSYLPHIGLMAAKSDSNTTVRGNTSDKSAEEYGVEASWQVFNGFATQSEVEKNSAELRNAQAIKNKTSIELRYELRAIYFQYISSLENIRLLKKIRDRQNNNIYLMRLKYKSGSEALWSVNQAEANLAEVEKSIENEELELEKFHMRLLILMGLSNSTKVIISDSIDSYLKEIKLNKEIDLHPEKISLEEKIAATEQLVRKARSDYYPSVVAEYSYKKVKNDATPERVNVSTIGVRVNFPIFDGLSTNRNVERALAEKSALELEKAYSLRNLRMRLFEATVTYKAKLKAVPIAVLQFKIAQNRVEVISEQYKMGLKKFLDWEQAQQKLLKAEQEEIQIKKEALLARADLEFAHGLQLGED